MFIIFVLNLIAVFFLASVCLVPDAATAKTVKIDGSSTVYPIAEAVAEEFQKAKRGAIKVTVGISGTGGGFKKFCRGETDIINASRPIIKKEIEACEKNSIQFIELPIAYDALAIVVNPQNTWVKSLTTSDLKKMWEPQAHGKIKKWNQVNPQWPNSSLNLYGPGADSGTFDYFTETVVGKLKSSRADFTASEDDNVLVQGISRDKNALGYIGFAYYEENKTKLKLIPVDSGKGAILPSDETVMKGTYTPLSRPLFIYVNMKSAANKPETKEFVDFFIKHAPVLTKKAKFIPLPQTLYDLVQTRFSKLKSGSLFGGEVSIGLKIEDLMKLESK
jgi:phosphate transport system substrate-binding protein